MKYRLLKAVGHGANITVENTETYANIIIGRLNPTISSILEKAGHEVGKAPLDYADEWNIEIEDSVAQQLADTTLSMSKPFRDQSKKAKIEKKATSGDTPDAFDLIFGTSNI